MTKAITVLLLTAILSIGTLFSLAHPAEARSTRTSSHTSHVTTRHYKSGGRLKYQKPYVRKSTGKFVQGHLKTTPDQYKFNNRKSILGY